LQECLPLLVVFSELFFFFFFFFFFFSLQVVGAEQNNSDLFQRIAVSTAYTWIYLMRIGGRLQVGLNPRFVLIKTMRGKTNRKLKKLVKKAIKNSLPQGATVCHLGHSSWWVHLPVSGWSALRGQDCNWR
jgi:hypothetical protein